MGNAGAVAPPSRHDIAFAACLALVLGVGVLGVLLLNTSMQRQASSISAAHQRLSALSQQVQQLRTGLDWAADPQRLAAQARALHVHLRPVQRVDYLRLSERRREAARDHAG